MQQVRVIVATSEEIDTSIEDQLTIEGWHLLGPVQWGGSRRESVPSAAFGVSSIERVVNLYVATLVKEIP